MTRKNITTVLLKDGRRFQSKTLYDAITVLYGREASVAFAPREDDFLGHDKIKAPALVEFAVGDNFRVTVATISEITVDGDRLTLEYLERIRDGQFLLSDLGWPEDHQVDPVEGHTIKHWKGGSK